MPESNELYGISLDMATGEIDIFSVSEPPKDHRFGMYVSHRTGTKDQMESLKGRVINYTFRILKREK